MVTTLAISFLILINPFAQFLYLKSVIDTLTLKQFMGVYGKATVMGVVICVTFAMCGESLFDNIFNIDFNSFKIFGGIVLFSYAYTFIIRGSNSLVQIRENLDDLASEIAIPFMIGAGTIYLSILLAHEGGRMLGSVSIVIVMLINYIIVIFLAFIKDHFRKKEKVAFDKYMSILMRVNGFFMGAIGIDMVVTGIMYFIEKS